MKEILVIIPAYNEAGSIERVVEGCRKKLPEADYLVVNDGSSDDTAKILRANGYRALYLPVNLGLAGAFRAGMRYADEKGYRAAVQFDGDGQHRAEYIPAMYE
ncbi:MAG: glycosyltransferase family 2 protein, partial [Stomatobaculum longum]|nr:glycosyltransferase family 2 protein [Stomatobaculum longum]